MKINKFALIWSCCIILSGCTTTLTQTDETSSQEESKVIKSEPAESGTEEMKGENLNQNKNKIEVIRGYMIDEQIVSPIGDSKTYFESYGDINVKVHLVNTGTERFVYSIRDMEDRRKIATGILMQNESYEQVFEQLPKGFYTISTVVQDEEPPIEISLSVKVDLVELSKLLYILL